MHGYPVPRGWFKLNYLDPERILTKLREIALTYPLHELRREAATLRTRELRPYGEGRQAALFCYGMSRVIGSPVEFAQCEEQDFDVIARYRVDDEIRYVPIQLKEWVPQEVNAEATLSVELAKLDKYADSQNLVVAFHLNRNATIQFSELRLPKTKIGALWFFGAREPTQRDWWLIGNLLNDGAVAHEFQYPGALPGGQPDRPRSGFAGLSGRLPCTLGSTH